MSILLMLQQQFAQDAAKLILKAKELGYDVTLAEAYRTPQQAMWDEQHGTGISNSLHTYRLAIDLNLFKDGEYLTGRDGYAALGAWWKTLSPEHCWGGDFQRQDNDHYSITPDGGKTK